MAAQWSSETFVAEFKDLQANAMAVDCLGKWALLLGKKVLAFVNLDNPDVGEHGENVVRIPRNSKWDPSCVQFNPHASHAHLFVTACNQRLDIYDMNDRSGSPMCSLKAHSRIISDVDWSTFDVNVVASCSIDCFTFLWDIRDSNRPIYSFQTVAGAHQVKWNKVTNNLFATTHEGDVRIWDPRKGNTPLQYIGAHLSKIYGLDWSPMSEHHLVTASQDCYVKLWDFTNPRRCDASINSGAPVWRARYTPFGAGLVTVVVPQVRRGENSLYLWSINGQSQMHPIHTFVGHKDVVLEFQWRKQPEGVRDQQLVTWSRDQSLRIWKIEPNLQRLCGHDIGDSTEIELASTSYNSSESTVKDFREFAESTKLEEEISITMATIPMEHQPQTLQQEFSLINKNIPNITIDEMDAINRTCRVTGISRGHRVSLELTFPPRYPNNAAPSFQFVPTTNLEPDLQKKIIKVLNDTCLKHVKRNNNCLEPCLRQLIGVIDSIMDDRRSPETDTQFTRQQQAPIVQSTAFLPVYSLGSFQDSAVPFPRTSGGRFCSNGMLVAFGVPAQMKKLSGGTEVTPKALSDLAAFTQTWKSSGPSSAYSMLFSRSPPTPSSDQMSISDFFTLREKDKKGRHSSRAPGRPRRHDREQVDKSTKKQQSVGKVKIYNMEGLLSVSHSLAKNYKLDINDIKGTCCHNASVSASIGRRDLVQVWTLVGIMSSKMLNASSNPDCGIPWAVYPMGRTLLKEILDHYAKQYDVQTLAMLCCLFGSPESGPRMERSSSKPSVEYVPPNTDTNITYYQPGSSTDSGWNLLQNFVSPSPFLPTRNPTSVAHPGTGHMSEVASQPNLAALFKAGRSQSVSGAAVTKNKRSLSWSDSYDDFKAFDIKSLRETPADQERMQHEDTCRMLDPELWEQYDSYKLAYARILYNWHLLNQRAQILNFISTPVPPHKGIEFSIYCHVCHRETRGPQCNSCKYLALQCAICHIGVRGSSNFCLACGHGGHTAHMMEWFSQEFVCPTGCGCHCLSENVFG